MQFWETNNKLEKSYFSLPVLYSESQYGCMRIKFVKMSNLKRL